jgi:ribosomal protein S12 methylthiotransferase accessory factor
MPNRAQREIPRQWLAFLGRKLGLAKSLSTLSIDPDDFDLHHVLPAATSLSRLLGRTGELQPRAGGVGITLRDAINRAMGELLERYASLSYDDAGRILSSHKELLRRGYRAVPFETLVLFTPQQRLTNGFPYAEVTEDTLLGWLEGIDLTDGSSIYVPGQLVSLGYIRATEEVAPCFYATSSGCAVATSMAGAILAGLLELIERDAVMMRWYSRLAPPRLDLDAAELLDLPLRRRRRGLDVRFHDMTLDGDVPVVGVTCTETSGRPCCFLLSAAAALDTASAARKALLEAGQGRPFIKFLAVMHEAPHACGVFDDFDLNLRFYAEPSNRHYVEWFFENPSLSDREFAPVQDDSGPEDLLRILLRRCIHMRITPIAFDMTTVEMLDQGLFACKIIVPELVPLCVPSAPFLGHPRLARYISANTQSGRDQRIPIWLPHPFP